MYWGQPTLIATNEDIVECYPSTVWTADCLGIAFRVTAKGGVVHQVTRPTILRHRPRLASRLDIHNINPVAHGKRIHNL